MRVRAQPSHFKRVDEGGVWWTEEACVSILDKVSMEIMSHNSIHCWNNVNVRMRGGSVIPSAIERPYAVCGVLGREIHFSIGRVVDCGAMLRKQNRTVHVVGKSGHGFQ